MAEYTTVADGIEQLTRFQLQVYDYIVERTLEDGSPPTVREISSGTGLSSTAVFHHIEKMKDVGLIRSDIGRRRYRVAGAITTINVDAPLYFPHYAAEKEMEESANGETLDD